MHKLIYIDQAAMTRFLLLKNVNTGTVEECFDDSAMFSDTINFNFMEINEEYDCKILLFGDTTVTGYGTTAECTIKETNIAIGNQLFVKVFIENDEYYILQTEIPLEFIEKGQVLFEYTRKDLLQVNDVIHSYRFRNNQV